MMKIEITSPVDHDGKRLEIGAKVDLPAELAQALVKAGAAIDMKASKVPETEPDAK